MTNVPQLPHEDGRDDGNRQGRRWSIGSELLGHQPSHEANRYSSNETDDIIDVYDGTGQTAKEGGDLDMEGGKPQFTRTSTNAIDRVITDWWWWELLSWHVSAICIGAIVIVLIVYSEQPLPHWPLGITLNAYISVLAALAKAALMLPVAEAIGQLKWIWFRRKSKLMDFFTFDSASRGPWGSLMLLGSTRCRHLASLGAAITILALAFETFFQQIVSYPERPIVLGNGSITTAVSYGLEASPHEFSDPLMSTTIMTAILGSNDTILSPQSTCATSNCTWSQYSSLGVCSQCKDVSNILRYVCKNYTTMDFVGNTFTDYGCGWLLNDTLLVGTYLNGVNERQVLSLTMQGIDAPSNTSRGGQFHSSTHFKEFPFPIFDFYVGYAAGGKAAVLRNDTPVALECLLHWCAKSYVATHSQGILNETLVDTFANYSAKQLSPGEVLSGTPPIVIRLPFGHTTFSVSSGSPVVLTNTLSAYLSQMIDEDDNVTVPSSFQGILNVTVAPPYDFNSYMGLLTTSMTNNLRTKIKGTEAVTGTAWSTETFVRIRWVWISLPVFLLLTTLAFVLGTIAKSSRQKAGTWKTSALAVLLHGLSSEARHKLDPKARASQVEATARKMDVMLSSDNEGIRLVLA